VQRLQGHRGAVREAQPADAEDAFGRRDVEGAADLGPGVDIVEPDRPAVGNHSAPAHVLAEGRQRQLLRDLRLADERAAAVPPDEVALAHEVVEGSAQGQARDAELLAEAPLGRDRLADAQALD
jgi:hypothetical protein